MTERSSLLRDLIELAEIKEFKELVKKEEKKDAPNKWWILNPIKVYIILVLLYPFIGRAYMTLFDTIWK